LTIITALLLSSPAWAALSVTSTAFVNGGIIPPANTYNLGSQCQGNNLSPQLTWAAGPAGTTTTYRIEMVDLTAGNFLHWQVTNIPNTTTSLPQGGPLPAGSIESTNGFGTAGYGGPCPPADGLTHQYVITVSALSATNTVLDSGTLTGTKTFSGTITVPNVVGQLQGNAIATLQSAGLTTAVNPAVSALPVGTVISQNPVAGNNVAYGALITLTVSSGSGAIILVPNVLGQTQNAATVAIQNAGFAVSIVYCTPAAPPVATCPAGAGGTVNVQNPAAGANAVPGSTVTLTVVSADIIPVPNVVGLTQSAAITAIQGAGLTVTVTTEASFTVPLGTVISQEPVGGILVAPATKVKIVVSTGSGLSATVPNVVGQTQSAAVAAIQNAGLIVTVTTENSTTVPAGAVISQDPVGGILVKPGSEVEIVVSSGFTAVTVPNVVGQTLATAKDSITGVNLKVGTTTLASSTTVAAGKIISQNPAGGAQVASGTVVNLVISSGTEAPINPPVTPGNISVPDVEGLTKTAATEVIRSVGLSVGATLQRYSDTVPAGIVIDQSPAAGAKVAIATPVSLTVSLGKAGVVTVPDVRGQPEAIAQSNLQNAGLTVGSTLRQPDPTMPSGSVISTVPAAGTQVELGSSVTLLVSEGFSQPQQCPVPDVTHQTVDNAREILFAVGLFNVGAITVQPSASIAPGLVSGQSPAAGTPVAYGTTINLFVSSGSQAPIATPNVVGLTLDEATVSLTQVGLKAGFVSRQTSNTVEAGRIISQSPLMTALVPVGWSINLVVSLGPIPEDPGARPQTQVPNVAGQTLAAATAQVIEAGLRVGIVSNQSSQDVPAGQVIRQSPLADATVPVSSPVNLVISFGPYAYTLLSGPAYVTNYVGGTVSILNPDINQTVDNIPTGINNTGPSGIAISPDGTRLYVVNRPRFSRSAGTVSVIDLTERKVIAVIPVGVAPLGVAVNPTGERLFVANEGSFSLSVIDTTTNQPFIDMSVPGLAINAYPRGVATHPNPLRPLVYVTNRTVNSFSDDEANPQPDQCDALVARPPINVNHDQCVGSLSIFDADIKAQVGSVAVGWAPEGVAVHPNGMFVYVANSGDRTVSVIETVFNRVVGIITLDEFGGAPQPLVPRGVAVSPDGNRLYVTDGAGNRLFVIDITANHAVVGIVSVGKTPYGVSVSPDSKRVYVANTDDNTVSVVDGRSNQVIAVVPAGLGPWAFGQFTGPLVAVAAPTFAPPGGSYSTSQSVKITTPTPGASIRYTTDGSTPTSTSGTLISNGQAVSLTQLGTTVLKAMAFKENWADSEVTEATYTIGNPLLKKR